MSCWASLKLTPFLIFPTASKYRTSRVVGRSPLSIGDGGTAFCESTQSCAPSGHLKPAGMTPTTRRGLAVHVNAPADRRRVRAEERVPRRLIEDDHRLGRHGILRGRERPPDRRGRAEDIEERRGHVRALYLLRVARRERESDEVVAHAGHRRERPVVVLDVEELSRGMAGPSARWSTTSTRGRSALRRGTAAAAAARR